MNDFQSGRRTRWLGFALGAAGLLLSACSLAGDVTPPPGATPLGATPLPTGSLPAAGASAEPTSATSALFPASRPAALEGGLLYLEHCAPCHGEAGAGDGSLATQLPQRPPDFSNPATLRARTPRQIFNTITLGNLQALMPPFGDKLTDAERWSLAAFLYALSTAPDQLAAGQAVYAANCAGCHGPDGAGGGPDAAGQTLPSFADQAFMAGRSQQDFFTVVSGGDAAHPFTGLSEADRWAALDAVRAFAYAYTAPGELTAEHMGAVNGQVVNGTPQGSVPAGLAVTVHSFEGQDLIGTFTTTAGADGGFKLDGIAFTPGRQFLATTEYLGITYASEVGSFDAAAGTLSVTVPIYEQTTDASALAVDPVHMFLEFISPSEVTVGQLFIFSNTGQRTFAADSTHPLVFYLPAGATQVNVQNAVEGQTFFVSGDTLGVLASIPPGTGSAQVLFSFNLPYGDALRYQQKMAYPVSGVDVLVSDLGVQVTGAGLLNLGLQDFQGQSYQNYSAGGVGAGQVFELQVSGKAGTGAVGPAATGNGPTNIAIGLGALVLALAGIGLWFYRRPRAGPAIGAGRDALLEAIAELDDAYAAGGLVEADYRAERAALKRELTKLWE